MRGRATLAAVVLIATAAYATSPVQRARASVEVRVPVPPIAVPGSDANVHLAYELHITNFYRSTGVLRLERVEALADPGGAAPLAAWEGAELEGRVMHPGAESPARYGRSIPGGMRVIVHVWITRPRDAAAPSRLRHRLVFTNDKGEEEEVDGALVEVRGAPPVVLGPPLRGGNWLVHNGPGNHRPPHWGSLLALNGHVTLPQRFAIDFIGVDESGKAVRGHSNSSVNEDWVGFGHEVIASVDGVVRDLRDQVADHAPLSPVPPPSGMTAADVYGNYVVIDVGGGTFLHYVHLRRNSVSVTLGQRVHRGQLLGRLGNSGNTNAPHLHFNVADSPRPEEAEGLPFVFDAFDALGETTADRALGGETSTAGRAFSPEERVRVLPLNGCVIRFQRGGGGAAGAR